MWKIVKDEANQARVAKVKEMEIARMVE